MRQGFEPIFCEAVQREPLRLCGMGNIVRSKGGENKTMNLTGNTFFFSWEVRLMEWLQAHIGTAGISVISFFSMFGEEMILILVLGFLYWGYNKQMGKTVGLTVLMGLVWNPLIKNIALRRRPYFDNDGIKILRVVEPDADIYDISAQGYSFPSGHSANAAALYGSLAVAEKKRWLSILAVVLPLLIGFSRVVVGAHYPTDVLAGLVLGAFAVAVIPALQRKIKNPVFLYGLLLITALPGLFYCKSSDYYTGLGLLIGFMGGTLLEEKVVRFENEKRPVFILLRMAGGVAVYFVLNKLLKLPFSADFLASGSYAALLTRCARYAVIAFVDFGVYPMLFRVNRQEGQK